MSDPPATVSTSTTAEHSASTRRGAVCNPRFHARRLGSGAQDPGAGGLEHGVERGREVRAAVADQDPDVPESLVEGEGKVAGLLQRPFSGGLAVTPPRCIRRVPCSMNTRMYSPSAARCPHGRSPQRGSAAWAYRNCRQIGPKRRGAGSMPTARRISQTVDCATITPSFVREGSPWIRRYPRSGFSFASRTTRRAMLRTVGGRPGARCLLCRTSSRLACGARRAMSLASQGRLRSSACGVSAGPARRTTSGRPARNAPGRRGGAAPRSRVGVPAAQHPSSGPCGTPGQRG